MGLLKPVVAALAFALAAPVLAEEGNRLDDLFAALADAESPDAEKIVAKISTEWSKSGSPAMDMLLKRGREAIDRGDPAAAIGHMSALVDHAPDFAEGYNGRATAYFAAKKIGPALDDIRTVLALNPRHFGAMTGLAIILEDLGHDEDALAAWREVQRLFPASPQAQSGLRRLERSVDGRSI